MGKTVLQRIVLDTAVEGCATMFLHTWTWRSILIFLAVRYGLVN
jgi:hypothetical protein